MDKTLNLFGEAEISGDKTSHLNSYLKLAYMAVLIANRPLHALEILQIAEDHNFLPKHLYGRTPHKTLNARLAEHIREEGTNSLFFRTKPATYFLTDLAEQSNTSSEYKVFHGVRRSKQISQEDVLVAPRKELQERINGFSRPFDDDKFRALYADICYFKDRAAAEEDQTVKQFVTFTIFHHKHHLLIYKRGSYSTASNRLQGALSVGFGGHVNNDDFDLFTDGPDALIFNSSRELLEELYLDKFYPRIDHINSRSSLIGYLNVDDSKDAQHHIAVLIAFSHDTYELPRKGELSINELQWLDTQTPLNDLSDYDLWSKLILTQIYQGNIRLVESHG